MSAREEMAKILEQWLQLTRAEGGAIESAAWPCLKEIQAAKSSLQNQLSRAKEKWEAENPGAMFSGPDKHPFRAELGRLLSLETRNEELLAAQLRRAHAAKESLNEAVRNLRNVQQTYVLKRAGILNCYS